MYFTILVIVVFLVMCKICSEVMIRDDFDKIRNTDKYNRNAYMKLIEQSIKQIDGRSFEIFCAKLFELKGDKVELTQASRDGGKDIIVKRDGITYYVECKCYADSNVISTNHIHKLISACVCDGITNGIFITTSSYSKDSIELIEKCKVIEIERWYIRDLLRLCDDINMCELLVWMGYDKQDILNMSK